MKAQRQLTVRRVGSRRLGDGRDHTSQFRVARRVAGSFGLSDREATGMNDHVVSTIRSCWAEAYDEAQLSRAEAHQPWGREILNDYAFWEAV